MNKSVLFGVKNEEKNCFVLDKNSWKKGKNLPKKRKEFGRKEKKNIYKKAYFIMMYV